MKIPPHLYVACTQMTKADRERLQIGMSEQDVEMMNEIIEITGHHEPDYEAEMPFASNHNEGNEDWLEP